MLALVLVFANAYCFERCLIPTSAADSPPCHPHGAPNVSHWAEPHSLSTAPAPVAAVATAVAGLPSAQTPLALLEAAARVDSSPPHGIARPSLYLRI